MTVNTVLIDFACAAFFILISQIIRSKVKIIQSSFIPASLLAGLLGLLCGPSFLNIVPFSESIGSYAGVITIFVFASIGLNGFSFSPDNMKRDLNRMGAHLSYKTLAFTLQMCIPIAFSILVISKITPDINYGFGLLLAAGFYGGHGTAAAVGTSFEKLGFVGATDLGMTCATAGILTGIFGGLLFIKWATKKGYTQYVNDFSNISDDIKTGLIPPANRLTMGSETISPVALDPLAFHLALILVPSGLGYLTNTWIANTFGLDLPTFTVAFLFALLFFCLFGGMKKNGVYKYIDDRVINRLGSCATDFMVFFGVASIKLTVIIDYALPLALLVISGILVVFFFMRFLGPAMNKESWFERSIFVLGYATGVFTIGLTLLRIVDPENKSKTLSDTAIVGVFNTPIELFAWSAGPIMLMTGKHWLYIGIFALMSVGCIVLSMIFKWWYVKIPLKDRGAVEIDDYVEKSA